MFRMAPAALRVFPRSCGLCARLGSNQLLERFKFDSPFCDHGESREWLEAVSVAFRADKGASAFRRSPLVACHQRVRLLWIRASYGSSRRRPGLMEATSFWHGHSGRLDHVSTIPWPNSLGLFYAAFTRHLGFQPNSDEWKVMGLAPYGNPSIGLEDFIRVNGHPYRVDGPGLIGTGNGSLSKIAQKLGPPRLPESEISEKHKNLAFSVQEACEQAMMALVRDAVTKTGCRNLCLAGGVALNSKANGKILTSGLVDNLFVQPASSDDGVALGAALAPYLEADGRLPMTPMHDAYLGMEYGDSEVKKTLDTYKLRSTRLENPAGTAAELLFSGKIIGWFQGRMEFGPRAPW